MCCGEGHYDGYTQRTGGHYDLTNRIHMYDALYINNTEIIDDHDYTWQEYRLPTPQPFRRATGTFPWVLYTRKLRNKNV